MSDYLGTPTHSYDKEGKEVWHRQLDIYGRRIKEDNDFVPFLYQGQYYDRESGLAYNRFRYYSPSMGMYVSQDPIGLNSRNYNLYSYVRDTNRITDPFGLDWAYILEDSKGKPYYVGRAGDDMSLMDVARRHNATEGTIDGARFGEGDTLKRKTDFDIKPDPVRGLEQIGIDDIGGKIGRSQEFRQGNNIDGISERKRKKADGKKRMK